MFAYEVNFWDDMDNTEAIDYGFVCGENYKEASENLADYYGDDSIIELKLFALTEKGQNVYSMKDLIRRYEKWRVSAARSFSFLFV